jgi:hypothetical protein
MVCYQVVENNIIYEEGIFIIDDLPELEEDNLYKNFNLNLYI